MQITSMSAAVDNDFLIHVAEIKKSREEILRIIGYGV